MAKQAAKEVVCWLGPNELMVPAAQLAGAIAEAMRPLLPRIEAAGEAPNDPHAVERLMDERRQTSRLITTFGPHVLTEGVSPEDARAFVAALDLELKLERRAPTASAAILERAEADEEWIKIARALADQIALDLWSAGQRRISGRDIAPLVADEMRKEAFRRYWGLQGPRGDSNIRAVGLKGWVFIPPA